MGWLAPTSTSSGSWGSLNTFASPFGALTIAAGSRQQTVAAPVAPLPAPPATPVTPTYDPKIDANTLYGRPMTLAAIGSKPVRFGGAPAPIVGPYINSGKVDFISSIALIVPVDGSRKLFNVYLDQEKAWSSATGWDGSGAQPGDAIYHAETFDLAFRPGTLSQSVLSLETDKFPGDENAYRPQVLIEIRNLPFQRYMDQSGRPVPYVSADIGDFSDGRGPDEQINLGEALELIAHSPWAGYTSDTFEAVTITDAVDGILLKDNFTVVDLCRSVTRIYRNIDLLQSDKLRVKDRGNVNPDFVFDRDSIIGDVQIVRAGATAQRRELELIAIDPDQDYTAVPSLAQIPRNPFVISAAVGKETITSPLVLDASTRQSLVTFAQQYEENARKKVSLKVRAIGYEIEPGDLFALSGNVADGIDGEVFKATQTEHLANYVVAIEGEAILRCAAYEEDLPDPHFGQVILLMHCDGAPGSTTFTDSSSFAHTLTAQGNAQVSATSKFGSGALLCDGAGDGVVTGVTALNTAGLSPTNTSPYTIECWARFNSVGRVQFLIAVDTGVGGRYFRLYQNGDDELVFEWGNAAVFIGNVTTTAANITTGVYTHIVVDKDSTGKIRLYVRGVMEASDTPADSTIGAHVEAIMIGTSFFGSSFDGLFDEVRITRGASRYGDVYGDSSFTPPIAPFPDS